MAPEFVAASASISRKPLRIALAFLASLGVAPAAASTVFASGPFVLPQGITAGLNGTFILSDTGGEVYSIPASGGAVTSGTPMGFRIFGEIALPSGYAQSGQYLAYGTDQTRMFGVAALTSASGLGAPVTVLDSANGWFADAVVAPENFGAIAQGQVVLSNEFGVAGSSTLSAVDTLGFDAASVSTFAILPTGAIAYGVGFAPESFGPYGGDLFVSDSSSGNLYVLNAAGDATLFATLALPIGFSQPGLRQIAWAPDGFGAYGGDLFVSIAAKNGGGGTTGEIDVLDGTGQTVAVYYQGGDVSPLDPRGLFFENDTTLLVANADPGIQQVEPSDFIPVPELSTWAMMLIGFGGLGVAALRRSRKPAVA